MSTKKYHHGDLKAALLEAANKILLEKGVEALSLRAIASEVGVSHMAPYSHFKNKSELYQAIAASGYRLLASKMEAAKPREDDVELIVDYGTAYIEFALANTPLYRLMLSQIQKPSIESAEPSVLSDELIEASQKPIGLLSSAFVGITPAYGNSEILAQGARAMVHGLAMLLIDQRIQIPEGMTVREYLRLASLQLRK